MLGADWVEYVHDELINKFWPGIEHIGSKGVKDRKLLESAVARPFQTVFGEDAYPTLVEKAGALFHSLVANHPFHDGNKRTAVTALHHFVIANGFFSAISNEEAYELAKRTASYRARGLTHEQALREIRDLLGSRMILFSDLRKLGQEDSATGPYFAQVHSVFTRLRQKIRRSRLNRIDPSA